MEKLLNLKLEQIIKIKEYTSKILTMSAKMQDIEISDMLDVRQEKMKEVDMIDQDISKCVLTSSDTEIVKNLKDEIRQNIRQIIEMDKTLRKSINEEMKIVREKLSQPDKMQQTLNLKA